MADANESEGVAEDIGFAGGCPLCNAGICHEVGEKNGYQIVACGGCGLRYVKNMPSEHELADFYSKNYGNKKDESNVQKKVRRWILKLLPLKLIVGSGSFLDLGCNTGFAVEAARRLGFRAAGYDLSEQAIAIARKAFASSEFHHGMAVDAAKDGKRYDAVVCAEMIEHLTELARLSNALSSLVRPGGVLYLTTPDLGCANDELLGKSEVCPPEHLIYFGRKQVEHFLREAGFKVLFFVPVLNKPSIRVFARRVPDVAGAGLTG